MSRTHHYDFPIAPKTQKNPEYTPECIEGYSSQLRELISDITADQNDNLNRSELAEYYKLLGSPESRMPGGENYDKPSPLHPIYKKRRAEEYFWATDLSKFLWSDIYPTSLIIDIARKVSVESAKKHNEEANILNTRRYRKNNSM